MKQQTREKNMFSSNKKTTMPLSIEVLEDELWSGKSWEVALWGKDDTEA